MKFSWDKQSKWYDESVFIKEGEMVTHTLEIGRKKFFVSTETIEAYQSLQKRIRLIKQKLRKDLMDVIGACIEKINNDPLLTLSQKITLKNETTLYICRIQHNFLHPTLPPAKKLK